MPAGRRLARLLAGARWALGDFPTLALLFNLAFVLWLPARSYADLWASTRNAQGMLLAALVHPAWGRSWGAAGELPQGSRLWVRSRWLLAALWASCAPLLWLA